MTYNNQDPKYRHPKRLRVIRFLISGLCLKIFHSGARGEVLSRPLKGNPAEANTEPDGDYAVWLGHSSVLCRQESVYYLTDPIFSERASPFASIGPRRYSPPGMRIDELPKISFVLISHNHYDHLDLASVKAIYDRDRPVFYVPKGLTDWFNSAGIETAIEIGWWESVKASHLTVTSVPAQHFSARTLWDRNNSHWCGWVVGGKKKFYYSGDSGYFDGFKEVGEKLGPIELAALPIGAYEPSWLMRRHHLNPEQALDVFEQVRGGKLLAVHWGSFDLTYEPYDEPPKRLKAEAAARGYTPDTVNILRVGELLQW